MPQGGYLSTDPYAGQPLSTDPYAGDPETAKPSASGTVSAKPSWLNELKDYLGTTLSGMDPVTNTAGAIGAALRPVDTARGIGQSHEDTVRKAEAAFKKGNYAEGVRHSLLYLLPVFGPQLDQMTDKLQEGKIGEGLGEATAFVGNLALAKGLSQPSAPRAAAAPTPVRDAVQWGMKEGVPVDAATATQNPVVRAGQHIADRSLIQAVTGSAKRAQDAQAAGLTSAGERLAARAYPTAQTAQQAGTGARAAVEGRLGQLASEADTAYGTLRGLEAKLAKPVQVGTREIPTGVLDAAGAPVMRMEPITETIGLPVDLKSTKQALRPVFDQLMRQYPVTQQQASPGLKAIQNILEGPDKSPLSVVDGDLSAIKSLARTELPALRTKGQGVAASAVSKLEDAVLRAAANAPPDVMKALQAGRNATKAKYAAQEVWDALKAEPVRTVQGMIAPKDSAITQLSELNRLAPEEVAKMGRAYLDDLLGEATASGGFDKAGTLQAKWTKLGAETKKLLFKDPEHVKDLDRFFLLASKMAENPNPSGTAHNVLMGTQGGLLVFEPVTGAATQISLGALSKLLHSKAGVKLLTSGLTTPVTNTARAAGVLGQLWRMANASGETLTMAPATVGQSTPPGQRR